MDNVYDQAHALARALKESAPYKEYERMKNKVSENEKLSAMINDFREKSMEVQTKQMLGEAPEEGVAEQVQSLYQIVMGDPLAAQFFQTEMHFTQVVTDIYRIIGEAIQLD